MELRHLRYFVTVADELHFGRAAARLNIAQPPLSQQIRRLEEELDVQLFERSKRQVRLTPAGKVFLQHARQTLIQAEQAVQAAQRAARGDTGRIEVGFTGTMSCSLLPLLLRRFYETFPDVEVVLHELLSPAQVQALRERKIHIGFVRGPMDDPALARECVMHEKLIVALPEDHPLAKRPSIPPASLAEEPFVAVPRSSGVQYYEQVMSLCRRAGFSPRIVQEASHLSTIVSLVAAGLGVALVPDSLPGLERSGVVYRPLDGVEARITLLMAWHRDASDPILLRFLEVARHVIAESLRESDSRCP